MKWLRTKGILLGSLVFLVTSPCTAAETETFVLEDVRVTATRDESNLLVTPDRTEINYDDYTKPSPVKSIVDVLRDQPVIDFRSKSDLDMRSDWGSPILMRGFDVRRFVNSIDGITFDKPLNYGQLINYTTVPLGQVERIEVIPGSHSALYWGKSIGGVINVVTREPRERETTRPNVNSSWSYGSYDTVNSKFSLDGGNKSVNYGLSGQHLSTNGNLRHGYSKTDNLAAVASYLLPSDGYVKYMFTYTEQDLESFVKNDPGSSDYDDDYPVVKDASRSFWQDPVKHMETFSHRVTFNQPTSSAGTWSGGITYTEKAKHWFANNNWVDKDDKDQGVARFKSPNATQDRLAYKLQDEICLFDGNTLIVGFDGIDFYEEFEPRKEERYRLRSHKSGFIQDTWEVTSRLTVRPGVRYENVDLKINNYSNSPGWGSMPGYQVSQNPQYIKKSWDQFMPKSFVTYELDDLWSQLRDTSISVGASKVWNVAPYCLV